MATLIYLPYREASHYEFWAFDNFGLAIAKLIFFVRGIKSNLICWQKYEKPDRDSKGFGNYVVQSWTQTHYM
jgi:hypothetical protein